MPRKYLLIGHAEDETDDRVSAYLSRKNIDYDWVFPYAGQPLPLLDGDVAGIVVYGGRFDVHPRSASPFLIDQANLIETAFARDVPVLGICLGAQLMADVLGARPGPHPDGFAEYGYYPLQVSAAGRAMMPEGLMVLESHWHGWYDLPNGATHLAHTELFPQQAFRYASKSYALQFHPETSLATMTRWVNRRGARNDLPGAFPVEQQFADHAKYDAALGDWFGGFLDEWTAPAKLTDAAE